MSDINENTNNIYVIKRRLAELTKAPGTSCFRYYVGDFSISIFTNRIQEHVTFVSDRITLHEVVDVSLYEYKRDTFGVSREEFIYLDQDARFKNYKPIKYSEWEGLSQGREMPINHLCELIKYLYRLSNLSAFM